MGKNLQQQGFFGLFSLTYLTICNAQLPFGKISASKNESVITVNFGYDKFETETKLLVYRSTTPKFANATLHATISSATLVDEGNLMVNYKYYYWFKSVDRHGERGYFGGNDYGQIVAQATVLSDRPISTFGGSETAPVLKATATRLALVIGNGVYTHVTPATTAVNDARFVANQLRKNGWFVAGHENLETRESFKTVIAGFLNGIRTSDTILIYFSGHGVQVNNNNYLVPQLAKIQKASDLPQQAFLLDWLQTALKKANCQTQIVLLDACKSNVLFDDKPLEAVSLGLNIIDNQYVTLDVTGTRKGLVAYATPGKQTDLTYSAFTGALKTALETTPCLDLNQLLENAQTIFLQKTGSLTVPWKITTSLSNEVYFQKCD